MDLTELRGLLMLDLKMTLDSEISTAEANRAIQRSTDDLSRHIPRERIYETTYKNVVIDDSFTSPATSDTDKIVAAGGLVDTTDGDTLTLATTWMDVPRPVIITLTDANDSITRMTVIVKGIDIDGAYKEERFYRHNGKVQTGKVYFNSISEVEVNEIYGSDTNDTLDVGSGSHLGVWVQLDNPIEPESESVYSAALKAGTKYTRDTDFEMDYANGRINLKTGTTMAAGTTYYTNYNKSNKAIDISAIIPELSRITKVIYPVDKIPEQSVAFSIWQDMLTIGSPRPGVSQESLTDGEHIAIYYETRQTPPTETGSGSYPEILDQVVAIGAAGYALLMEALQYEMQAVTDLASVRTELGKVTTLVTPSTGKIDLALTKVALYLETSDTTDNAKDVLANITDDVAELRTKIIVAEDAIATYLGAVSTTDLDAATVGSVAWLLEGELTINKLNDGENVPALFSEYARTKAQLAQARTQAAMGYAQEATTRLANLRTYIEEASGWIRIGETFIVEAQTLIGEVNAIIAEATQYQETVANDMLLSDRFRAEAQIRLNEFNTILASKAEYRKRVVDVSVRQPA